MLYQRRLRNVDKAPFQYGLMPKYGCRKKNACPSQHFLRSLLSFRKQLGEKKISLKELIWEFAKSSYRKISKKPKTTFSTVLWSVRSQVVSGLLLFLTRKPPNVAVCLERQWLTHLRCLWYPYKICHFSERKLETVWWLEAGKSFANEHQLFSVRLFYQFCRAMVPAAKDLSGGMKKSILLSGTQKYNLVSHFAQPKGKRILISELLRDSKSFSLTFMLFHLTTFW